MTSVAVKKIYLRNAIVIMAVAVFLIPVSWGQTGDPVGSEIPYIEISPAEFLGAPVDNPVLIICHNGQLIEVRPEQEGPGITEGQQMCLNTMAGEQDFGCPEPDYVGLAPDADEGDGCLEEFPSYKKLSAIYMFYGGPSNSYDTRTTGVYNNYVAHDSGSNPGTSITWYKARDEGNEVGLHAVGCHTYKHWKSDHSGYASSTDHWHGTQMEASIREGEFTACDLSSYKGYWGGAMNWE